jgi:hypothetical protein
MRREKKRKVGWVARVRLRSFAVVDSVEMAQDCLYLAVAPKTWRGEIENLVDLHHVKHSVGELLQAGTNQIAY